MQNKHHVNMQIDELQEDPLGHPKNSPWVELLITDSNQDCVKIVEISPSRTLKISPSLSTE